MEHSSFGDRAGTVEASAWTFGGTDTIEVDMDLVDTAGGVHGGMHAGNFEDTVVDAYEAEDDMTSHEGVVHDVGVTLGRLADGCSLLQTSHPAASCCCRCSCCCCCYLLDSSVGILLIDASL